MRLLNLANSSLVVLLFSSLVCLNACSSDGEKRPEYLDAAATQTLEIPPQLSAPDTNGALLLPEPSDKAKQAFASGVTGSDVKEIAPEFKGIRLKNDAYLYWLEIDSPIEKVWDSLPNFLAAEGITAERVEKLMGFVDTQWMNEYQVTYGGKKPGGWMTKFFPDYKDKFRLRLEKVSVNVTNLYITHRGMQLVATDDSTKWVQRDSEAMLERELMYRYTLFAGADEKSATNLLAGYRSYQPRVIPNKDNPAVFQVQGNESTVWARLKVAMDRLGVDVVKTDVQERRLDILIGDINEMPVINNSGWFGSLFSREDTILDVDEIDSSVKEKDNDKNKKTPVADADKVKLSVVQVAGKYASEIKLENAGEMDGIALEFRNALVNQLK